MAHLATSPLAEVKVLPISLVRSSATTGISLSSSSAARIIKCARSDTEVARHASKALAAWASARSTSSSLWASNSATNSSVAGLIAVNDMSLVCQQNNRLIRGHGDLTPELRSPQRDDSQYQRQHNGVAHADRAHPPRPGEGCLHEGGQGIEQRQREVVERENSRAFTGGRVQLH